MQAQDAQAPAAGDRCVPLPQEGDENRWLVVPVFALAGVALLALGATIGVTAAGVGLAARLAIALVPCVLALGAFAAARAESRMARAQACFAGTGLTLVWPGLFGGNRQRLALSNVEGVTVVTGYAMERQRELARMRGERDRGLGPPFKGRTVFLAGYDAALRLRDGGLVALTRQGHLSPRLAAGDARALAGLLGLPFVEPGPEEAFVPPAYD